MAHRITSHRLTIGSISWRLGGKGGKIDVTDIISYACKVSSTSSAPMGYNASIPLVRFRE